MLKFCKVVAGFVTAVNISPAPQFISCPPEAMLGWTYNGATFTRVDLARVPPPPNVTREQERSSVFVEMEQLDAKMVDNTATTAQVRRMLHLIYKLLKMRLLS